MAAQLDQLAILDADIAAAWLDVLEAREQWSRSPCARTIEVERVAMGELDELLELRWAMR